MNICTWIGAILAFLLIILIVLPWYRRVWYISLYGFLAFFWAISFVTSTYLIINHSTNEFYIYNEYFCGMFYYYKKICDFKEFCGITVTGYENGSSYVLINGLGDESFGLFRFTQSTSKGTIEHYRDILTDIRKYIDDNAKFNPYRRQIYWLDETRDLQEIWLDRPIKTKSIKYVSILMHYNTQYRVIILCFGVRERIEYICAILIYVNILW